MAKLYDTSELRYYASVVQDSAETIFSARRTTVAPMREDIPEQLSGAAAKALEDTVTEMDQQLRDCAKELDAVGVLLKRYAFLLDEADRKASQMMQEGG